MSRWELALGWSGQLASGLLVTVALAVLAILGGTALGLAGALAARRGGMPARLLLAGATLIRSLPELLVIFAIYYGSAFVLQAALSPFGVTGFVAMGSFAAGALALALIHGSFCVEVLGGALAAVPPGPVEAARALGLSGGRAFCLVTLPLACRFALPGWMNLVIVSLKLTPLVAAIGLQDLLRTAGDAGRNTHDELLFYLLGLAAYLVLAGLVGLLQRRVETRLRRVWAG